MPLPAQDTYYLPAKQEAMAGSGFPKMSSKHAFKAMTTPMKFLEGKSRTRPKGLVNAVFVYSDKLLRRMVRELGLKKTNNPYKGYLSAYESEARNVVVLKLGIGAPLTAATAEELICWGIRNFYIMGAAGSLSEKARLNSIVVCSKAVRDEGTSHHYARPSLFAYPSKDLTAKAEKAAVAAGLDYRTGPSWTIDAPYRETFEEVRHYRNIGIVTVEMEAAALFAVATLRGAKSCAVFSVSDELYEEWTGLPPKHVLGYKSLAKIAAKLFRE